LMLAIAKEKEYLLLKKKPTESGEEDANRYICARDLVDEVFREQDGNQYEILHPFKGEELVGLEYEPLFAAYREKKLPNIEKAWHIYAGDFVTTDSGTGIVHIASGYGEDDMNMAMKMKMPVLQHVNMDGSFADDLGGEFKAFNVNGTENKKKADEFVAQKLKEKGYLCSTKTYVHSDPHCWRCDTPLLNYATDSWFVDIDQVKKKMLKANKKINWVPEHIKNG